MLNEIKEKVAVQKSHIIYKSSNGAMNHVRNLKQVQNARYQFNKKKRLCWDEIYNIHVYNIEFNCISKLETSPSLSSRTNKRIYNTIKKQSYDFL